MRIFVVLMKDDFNGEQYDNYITSFTEYNKAEDFIREENGDASVIHRIERDYDGFHYYASAFTDERLDSGIYGILTEEIK